MGIGTFLFSLDVHIVNLALPTLVQALQTDFATVAWVPLSYSLMLSILVLGVARLGDLWNRKGLYLGGLGLFTLSSLACGIAPTIQLLITARVFQGAGAVFIAVLTPAIVTTAFPEAKRGLALGIIASVGWTGVSFGPTAGGLLLEYLGWRAGFLVNVPICLVSLLLVTRLVPQTERPLAQKSFDWLGACLLSVTLTSFLIGLTRLQAADLGGFRTLAWLGLAIAGLASFLICQSRTANPLIELPLLRSWKLSLSLILSLLVYTFINAVMFSLPFFLELVRQYPQQTVGLMVSVMPILGVCSAPVAGYLADRFGERGVSTAGVGLLLIGCLAVSTFSEDLTVTGYILRMLPVGIGFGLFQPPNQSAILSSVPGAFLSLASGLWFFSRSLGQIVGISFISGLISILVASQLPGQEAIGMTTAPATALVFSHQVSFRWLSTLLLMALVLSQVLLRHQRRDAERRGNRRNRPLMPLHRR